MKGFERLPTFAFVALLSLLVANTLAANRVLIRQYLPDVYQRHYQRVRGHREISTRQGRRWQQTGTVEPPPPPLSPPGHNSISGERVEHDQQQKQKERRHDEHVQYGQSQPPPTPQIFFHSPNYTIVQAQTRTTAILHCEVTNIGNNTVTWKRRRDYKILTFGMLTYSSDSRFFTRPERNGKDWCLHIKYVQPDDAGLYECQVTSHPPASIFVDLQLVEARAEIVGGPDKIVKSGSSLVLSCVLRRSTEQPVYIFWYHGERMINYDVGGGATVRHGRQSSELLIPKADVQHAGNYSCVPSNARPVSVNVHVLHNEKPAAMQHGSKNSSASSIHDRRKYNSVAACLIIATLVVHHQRR